MGAMGATFLGASHPERFDAIGSLGGPVDFDYFLDYLERAWLGGFCPLEELEAIRERDPDHLDDPARLPCMGPVRARERAVLPEHEQHFARWVYANGFDRDGYLDLFEDLALALGNPLTWNPDTPFLPPGVEAADFDRQAICDDPVVLEGVYNAEYNPEGRYPVITFCDGEEPVLRCSGSGRLVDPCEEDPAASCDGEGAVETVRSGLAFEERAGAYDRCWDHRRPVRFALAVDINGNGLRDHGEPILVNARERFFDVGRDGCPNAWEDGRGGCLEAPTEQTGDPNGDDFDWRTRPFGTEGNGRWDPGEPWLDFGLDGVDGTGDFGERDGLYTESPGRARYRELHPASLLSRWSLRDRRRVAFFADGGVRDLFNFAISAGRVWSHFAARDPTQAQAWLGLREVPGAPASDEAFDPLALQSADLPRDLLFVYGDPAAGPEAIAAGDGDHVGTNRQVLNRLYLFLRWLSVRWEGIPDPPANRSSIESRTRNLVHRSAALGGVDRNFTVVLPPGYDDPANAKARYPVLFLLHGYGMRPGGSGGMAEMALLFDGAMAAGRIRKMIVVFPSGRCCHVDGKGGRVCTDNPPEGFVRECHSGSFYVDRVGAPRRAGAAYGTAILELLDVIDERFRTLPPER